MPLAVALAAVAFLMLVAAGLSHDPLFSIHTGLVALLGLPVAHPVCCTGLARTSCRTIGGLLSDRFLTAWDTAITLLTNW